MNKIIAAGATFMFSINSASAVIAADIQPDYDIQLSPEENRLAAQMGFYRGIVIACRESDGTV